MMDFADEIARHGLIEAVARQQERPDLRAFLSRDLERFKYNFRTVSIS
jgi:hypothetical protein